MLKFDLLKDGPVNNYIGSMFLEDNLKLVPSEKLKAVTVPTKEQLYKGLENAKEAVPKEYWEMIYKMVKERINHVKEI